MKTFFSRTLILLLSATVLFASCKKSGGDDDSGYYIKGKMDGTNFSYSNYPVANIQNAGTLISITLSAYMSSDPYNLTGLSLGIGVFNGDSIEPGIYTESDGGTDYTVLGTHNINNTSVVYGAGNHVNTAHPLKIVITSITNSEVTGSFEGAFYKMDMSNPGSDEYIDFTEGEFRLPLQ